MQNKMSYADNSIGLIRMDNISIRSADIKGKGYTLLANESHVFKENLLYFLGKKSTYILFANELYYFAFKKNYWSIDLCYVKVPTTNLSQLKTIFPKRNYLLITASQKVLDSINTLAPLANEPNWNSVWWNHSTKILGRMYYHTAIPDDLLDPRHDIHSAEFHQRVVLARTCHKFNLNANNKGHLAAIKHYQFILDHQIEDFIQYLFQNNVLMELIDLYDNNIHKELLFDYFLILANKGWPSLFEIIAKDYLDKKEYKNALKYYSLYYSKAGYRGDYLDTLLKQYKKIDHDHIIYPYLHEISQLLRQKKNQDEDWRFLNCKIYDLYKIAIQENNHTSLINLLSSGLDYPFWRNPLHSLMRENNQEIASLFMRYGTDVTEPKGYRGTTPRQINEICFDKAWLSMHEYFIKVFMILLLPEMHLNRDIAILILINMMSVNYLLKKEYLQLTTQAEESLLIKEIKNAYEKGQVRNSFFSYFNDANFLEKPTLKDIFINAFSGNSLTMRILKQLDYIDNMNQLNERAPLPIKRAFRAYIDWQNEQYKEVDSGFSQYMVLWL